MKTQLDFDQLALDCKSVTLDEAIKEINRENKMRRSVFQRWAKAQPTKEATYEAQYRKTAAIAAILATMTEKEWQRRMTAAFGQAKLF
ncbi:MAG TPA: hypothetical protein ENJ95_03585 [Bacteroidetes bacterium]|nr:hypothetical protein [Bacteroidota bacterium]